MYDAFTGRFIQPDTFVPEPGSSQGYNRYTYANNNPIKYSDPSGHNSIPVEDYINFIREVSSFITNLGYTIVGDPTSKSIYANGADMVAFKELSGQITETLAIELKNVSGSINLGTLGKSTGTVADYGGSISRVLRGADKFANSNIEQLKQESEALRTGSAVGNLRNVLITNSNNVSSAVKEQFDGVFSGFKDGAANVIKALPSVGVTMTNSISQAMNTFHPIIIPLYIIDPSQNPLYGQLLGHYGVQE
jgi:hypothetical protein